jgi:hypothetical protein
MAFAIARADPACGDADHQFMRSRARLRYLFDAIVFRCVADNRRHVLLVGWSEFIRHCMILPEVKINGEESVTFCGHG